MLLMRTYHKNMVLALEVTEHCAEVKSCPQCDLENRATFPVEATYSIQYGLRLKGLMGLYRQLTLTPW